MNSKGQHYGSAHTPTKSHHIGEHSGNVPDHKPYGSSKGWYHHAKGSCGSGNDSRKASATLWMLGRGREGVKRTGRGRRTRLFEAGAIFRSAVVASGCEDATDDGGCQARSLDNSKA
jgi:hypothetical protein